MSRRSDLVGYACDMAAERLAKIAPLPRGAVRVLPFEGDDEALLTGLKRRHPPAVTAFCERHGAHVRRVLGRILGADSELSDVHHEVFLRALEGASRLEHAHNLRGWLTVIAVNTARTMLKRRARRRWLGLAPSPGEPPEVAVAVDQEAAEALARTYRLLERMPAEERIAFSLRIIDGMSLEEVAEACAVSLATIKRRLGRAQTRFETLARRDEVLRPWLEEGSRWS